MALRASEAEKSIKTCLDRKTLRLAFPEPLESSYRDREHKRRRRRYLAAGIVGLILYNLFFIGDRIMVPDIFTLAWHTRLFVVSPIITMVMGLVFTKPFQRWTELFALALIVVTSVSIIFFLTQSHHPNAPHYYTGLIIIAFFGSIVARIRLITAVGSSAFVMTIYCLALPHMPAMGPEAGTNSVLVLFASFIISLFGTHQLEAESRRDFLHSSLQIIQTDKLSSAYMTLERASRTDGLTQVSNREYFDQVYAREWQNACRGELWLSLIFIDIDYFKTFNDCYGHLQGDEALKRVSATISQSVSRSGDMVARYGGEEFVVLLPHTQLCDAMGIAEKIQTRVNSLGIEHKQSATAPTLTLSLGVAAIIPTVDDEPNTLILQADEALYTAKNTGRNQVACATSLALKSG